MSNDATLCAWCGRHHAMVCPRVRAIEWEGIPDQRRIKRIEFFDLAGGQSFDELLHGFFKSPLDPADHRPPANGRDATPAAGGAAADPGPAGGISPP